MLKGNSQASQIIAPSTPITATGSSASTIVGGFNGAVAYLNVTAASGTTPNLAVKIQDSADNTTWFDVPSAAFTAVTAAGSQRLSITGPLGVYVRAAYTVTGTTPSFTADLTLAGSN